MEKMYLVKWTAHYRDYGLDHNGDTEVYLEWDEMEMYDKPMTEQEAEDVIPTCYNNHPVNGELYRDDEQEADFENQLEKLGVNMHGRNVTSLHMEPIRSYTTTGNTIWKIEKDSGLFTYCLIKKSELPLLEQSWVLNEKRI
jgi:hypothetical protein